MPPAEDEVSSTMTTGSTIGSTMPPANAADAATEMAAASKLSAAGGVAAEGTAGLIAIAYLSIEEQSSDIVVGMRTATSELYEVTVM